MWRVGVPWLMLGLGCAAACGRTERNVGRYQGTAATSDAGDSGSPATSSGGRSDSGGVGSGGIASEGGGDGGNGGDVASTGSAGMADVCANQRVGYGDYREQVVAEFSAFGCTVDSDCLAFYDQSACDPTCVLVITGARRGVVDRLNNFETSDCTQACWPEPRLGCPAAAPATCVSGRCQ